MARTPFLALACTWLLACGSANSKPACEPENSPFCKPDGGELRADSKREDFEMDLPALNRPAANGAPDFVGVSVLGNLAKLARPSDWSIRRARKTKERTYIEYVSPHGYLFAIYKREDGAGDAWKDIEQRYEDNAKAKGAQVVESHVPFGVMNGDAKEYVLHRPVKSQRGMYTNTAREILVRGDHSIVLVQVVHAGETPVAIEGDVLHVLESLEVN